jgi:hypothetical protein
MATVPKTGVYWPFKGLLQGAGIVLNDDGNNVTIATTGPGPGGGDMLKTEFATNGVTGKVDHAVTADSATTVSHASSADAVPWTGITGTPTLFPTDWSSVQNKPAVFPTSWAQISGIPTVFPPANHGTGHVSGGSDPIPNTSLTASGLAPMLSGNATDVLVGTGVFASIAPLVADTALLRAGDSLTPGAILVGTADAATSGSSPSTSAPFRAQSATQGGFGAIGLLCENFWGCALGAYQHGLSIATSSGNFQQLTDQTGKIIGAALAAGAAVTNIGYTPISGLGGQYSLTSPLILIKDHGLAAISYTLANLRVQSVTTAGRAQIGFHNVGVSAASLYYESDNTFRYITNAGAVARLHDSLHLLTAAELAAGAAIGNIGYTPMNIAGGTFTAGTWVHEQTLGLSAVAYQQAMVQFTTIDNNSAARPGIGFQHRQRQGWYLYFEYTDNTLRYINSAGTIKIVATTN